MVGLALAQELLDDLAVPLHPLRLVERTLVVIEAQPLHALEDRVDGLGGGALAVGVLDAQDERAAVTARVQPAEQGRADPADVQHAGGAGGEAGADGHGARVPEMTTPAAEAGVGVWWAVMGLNH